MNNKLRNSVLQWVKLSDKELDDKITDYIENNKLDFITAHDDIYHRSNIMDGNVRNRLYESFTRLAAKYIDDKTQCTIRRWDQMSDEDIEQEFLEIYLVSGHARVSENI